MIAFFILATLGAIVNIICECQAENRPVPVQEAEIKWKFLWSSKTEAWITLVMSSMETTRILSRASRPQDLTRPFFSTVFFRVTHDGLSENGITRSLIHETLGQHSLQCQHVISLNSLTCDFPTDK